MTDGATTTDPRTKKIGRYILRYLVAQGGMASVYLAQLPGPHGFEKWVAVKIIHPHLARNKRFVQMFLNEARVAARIHHPNVCSVIDFGIEERKELPYLVMEYLHGETFSNALRRARKDSMQPPLRTVARIVADAARGLHSAHELKSKDGDLLGVVHRDVSPQNILILYDGLSKVLDFGVARLRDQTRDTKSSEVKGKLSYMSPEQFRNEELDRRSDVWALGVVLWEATVGRQLFEDKNQGALIYSVLEHDIPKPSDVSEIYPADLEKVVMKALERDRGERYPTAAAMATDLEKFLYSGDEPAGPEQVGQWLSQIFADRLAARNALLRSQDLPIDDVPEVDLGKEDTQEISLQGGAVEVVSDREGRAGFSTPLIIVASAVVLALIAFAAFFGPWNRDDGGETVAGDLEHPSTAADARATDSGPRKGADEPQKVAPLDEPQKVATHEEPLMDFTTPADAGGSHDAAPVAQRDAGPGETPQGVHEPSDAGASTPESGHEKSDGKTRRGSQTPRGPPGKLNLLAIPPAEVRIGSRSLGRTPLFNVELPPGRYRLRLRALDGGATKTITVHVRPGQTVRRSVRL